MFSRQFIRGLHRPVTPPTPAASDGDSEEEAPPELDLDIKKLKTAKHKIKQRLLMEKDIIPRHPSSVIFNGSSNSGKTTLLLNLLTRPEFLKGYFDEIHLFSPTGGSDDLFQLLKLDEDHVHTDMRADDLENLMNEQNEIVEAKGIEKAPKLLVIFEDVQGDAPFMRSKPFKRAFLANRHFGMSTWLCGQSFKLTPRNARLQANNIFYFKGSGSEMECFAEEYTPPGMRARDFEAMLQQGTAEPHSFIHINQRVPHAERYRKGLKTIMDWEAHVKGGDDQYRDNNVRSAGRSRRRPSGNQPSVRGLLEGRRGPVPAQAPDQKN